MVAAIPTRKQQQTLGWEYHLLFTRFCELASVHSHPAFAHIPPPTSFPQTQWLLRSSSKQKVWMNENMMQGIEMLAHTLDQDWPDWAYKRTRIAAERPVRGLLPLAGEPGRAPDLVQHPAAVRATHVQPGTAAAYMAVVATQPPDNSRRVLQAVGDWKEREGGDAAAPGQLEDRSDIYVEGILGRRVEEGVQRGGGG
ncbi:hypothetical protein RHS03_07766, partial [Rhizoctonia solani]